MTPILHIQEGQSAKITANLLPCRIHRNGPVDPVTTYWTPEAAQDKTKTAYFRGRKLRGKAAALPEGYRGVVLRPGKEKPRSEHDDDDGEAPQVDSMEVVAGFDELVVWAHEAVPDASTDPYLKGVHEWLEVASKIHSYDVSSSSKR